jgi:predicted nucleic acid-binding protein
MGKESIASTKAKAFVMDSWAIIAYFEDEPAAGKIEEIIGHAHDANIPLLISVINAGEIWYTIAREASVEEADQSVRDIFDLGVNIVDADWNLTLDAARFKARGGIAYADCFAAALSKRHSAPLVTGDPEFKRFEKEIRILWV